MPFALPLIVMFKYLFAGAHIYMHVAVFTDKLEAPHKNFIFLTAEMQEKVGTYTILYMTHYSTSTALMTLTLYHFPYQNRLIN